MCKTIIDVDAGMSIIIITIKKRNCVDRLLCNNKLLMTLPVCPVLTALTDESELFQEAQAVVININFELSSKTLTSLMVLVYSAVVRGTRNSPYSLFVLHPFHNRFMYHPFPSYIDLSTVISYLQTSLSYHPQPPLIGKPNTHSPTTPSHMHDILSC
jgi:hypothetical protein